MNRSVGNWQTVSNFEDIEHVSWKKHYKFKYQSLIVSWQAYYGKCITEKNN